MTNVNVFHSGIKLGDTWDVYSRHIVLMHIVILQFFKSIWCSSPSEAITIVNTVRNDLYPLTGENVVHFGLLWESFGDRSRFACLRITVSVAFRVDPFAVDHLTTAWEFRDLEGFVGVQRFILGLDVFPPWLNIRSTPSFISHWFRCRRYRHLRQFFDIVADEKIFISHPNRFLRILFSTLSWLVRVPSSSMVSCVGLLCFGSSGSVSLSSVVHRFDEFVENSLQMICKSIGWQLWSWQPPFYPGLQSSTFHVNHVPSNFRALLMSSSWSSAFHNRL